MSDRICDHIEFIDDMTLEGIWHVSENGDDDDGDGDDDDGDDDADIGDLQKQEEAFKQGQERQKRREITEDDKIR